MTLGRGVDLVSKLSCKPVKLEYDIVGKRELKSNKWKKREGSRIQRMLGVTLRGWLIRGNRATLKSGKGRGATTLWRRGASNDPENPTLN